MFINIYCLSQKQHLETFVPETIPQWQGICRRLRDSVTKKKQKKQKKILQLSSMVEDCACHCRWGDLGLLLNRPLQGCKGIHSCFIWQSKKVSGSCKINHKKYLRIYQLGFKHSPDRKTNCNSFGALFSPGQIYRHCASASFTEIWGH